MFKIKLDTDNAAFDHPPTEIARILTELADKLRSREVMPAVGDEGGLLDVNGNRVGCWTYK